MSTHRTSYYHFSKPMATHINVANTAVVTANTAFSNAYDYWQQNINIEPPVIEGYYKGEHSPELYDAYWYHPDHLGSSSYITNLSGRVTQHMEYLPFGELLVDEHLNSHNSPFKFNAKEFDSETGNYYYGARYYDPKGSVWLSVDPLSEKYPSFSPYDYVANNPIMFIDPDGRDIVVSQAYQADFNKALASIFGEHAKSFTYDNNGKLSFTGNVKVLSKDQKYVFKQLNKLMKSSDITNIIYEKTYTITDKNNNNITLDISMRQGEGTLLKHENSNISENYVIIDPNGPSSINVFEVTDNYYLTKGTAPIQEVPPNFKPATVTTNPENSTWHGLGHVIFAGKSQDKVIKFDNRTRKMMIPPLPPRNPDETHNKTVTKGIGAIWEQD